MRHVFILIALLYSVSVKAETVYTVRGPEYAGDKRMDYDYAILNLALQKTVDEYGPYRLEQSMPGENFKRALQNARIGTYKNFFIRAAATPALSDHMASVPFPVDRGILGYRISFISNKIQGKIKEINTLDELRKYSVVQGIGWSDSRILKANGFKVNTGSSFASMFSMVTEGRSDLFLRGMNEILAEWRTNTNKAGLAIETSIAVHYPFPRFFYTTVGNADAAKRILTGLKIAYEDGSFNRIWRRHFGKSIKFVQLHNRKIFKLSNPFAVKLSQDYKKYNFDPHTYQREVLRTE